MNKLKITPNPQIRLFHWVTTETYWIFITGKFFAEQVEISKEDCEKLSIVFDVDIVKHTVFGGGFNK